MDFTRRDALILGAGAATAVLLPVQAFASASDDAIAAFTGGAATSEGGIELTAPEIAENGNTVPVAVSAPGAVSIILLADGNPNPEVCTFNFGELAGAGMGFGYASATPPAVKWFPAAKTGMIAGIVVSGFGLASVYAAPLATWLIETHGLQVAMRSLGIAFLVVVVGLSQLLKVPHKVEQFVKGLGKAGELKAGAAAGAVKKENFTPGEMMKTWQFYALWFMYACGSGAGLMIIFAAKKLGASVDVGVWFVVCLALGNGGGRILAGTLSDKLGRKVTLGAFLLCQAVLVLILSVAATKGSALNNALALTVLAALTGANYGSNLALFPAFAKDYYGLKNFGVNYGLIFTSWGLGGFMLVKLAGWVYDGVLVASRKGSYSFAFYTSATLLVLAAVVVYFMKAPHHTESEAAASEAANR